MFLVELETIRSIHRLTFTLPIHSLCHFRPVLPLHKNHALICYENGFYTMITLFHVLFSTFLKTFFAPFPECSTKAGLFIKNMTRIQTEKLPSSSHKQFNDN